MRRLFCSAVFIFVSMTLIANDKVEVKKALYDLTSGSSEIINRRVIGSIISNSSYYQSKLQEYSVIVVIHGDAYKFFMKDLNNSVYAFDEKLLSTKDLLGKRLSSLAKNYGVKFEVCGAGIKHKRLNPKAFYPFVTIIPNAISGLVDAQNSGYAYVPIH